MRNKYILYLNGKYNNLTEEEISYFDYYKKCKETGFLFTEYVEYEELIKIDNKIENRKRRV